MFNKIIFIFICFLTFLLGTVLNKGLSATNTFKGESEWKYDIPYVFTIGFNEIILILFLTVTIFTLFYIKYIESDSSRNQIKNMMNSILKIEILIFSFIVGTWWNSVNIDELRELDKNLYPIIILSLILYVVISYYKPLRREEFKNDLYKSREDLLKVINCNIKNSKRFSIVGDWGIGKSKLIENFFKGTYNYIDEDDRQIYFKNQYKHIYLDVSSYSNNQKVLEVLEDELNKSLQEVKILKLDKKISKEIFDNSNGYFNIIKKIFISEKVLEDSKEVLDKKIEEYQLITKKKVVLCLDNLERINDKERITNLLAVVEELFSNNIVKIYLYDKKYMEKIFGEKEFKKYIEKYSELEIKVSNLSLEEILGENYKELYLLIEGYRNKIQNLLENYLIKFKELRDSIIIKESKNTLYGNEQEQEKEKKEFEVSNKELALIQNKKEKIQNVFKKYNDNMFNPRYILGLNKFIESNYLGYSQERLLEYKIILDIFENSDLEDEIIKEIFLEKKTYEYLKKEEELYELFNGRWNQKKEKIDDEVKKLKQNALGVNAEDIYEYIYFNKRMKISNEELKEVFRKKRIYEIKKYSSLEMILEVDLEENINTHILSRGKVLLDKDFFYRKKEYYFYQKKEYNFYQRKNMLKMMLILYSLMEVNRFIKYIYNRESKYLEVIEILRSDGETFENTLNKKLNISFDRFLENINFQYENIKKSEIEKIINIRKLKKEFLILNNLKILDNNLEERQKTELNQNLFDKIFYKESEIKIKEFLKIEYNEIRVRINVYNIDEVISNYNLNFYIEKIKKIKDNIEAKELLFELYLLEDRLCKMEKSCEY